MFGGELHALVALTGEHVVDQVIEWVGVPIVLALPFVLAIKITFFRPASREIRGRLIPGLLLGLVAACAVVMANRQGKLSDIAFLSGETPIAVLLGSGIAVSMILLLLADKFALDIVLAFFVCLLTAATWIGLYTYFSEATYRSSIAWIALGVMIGGLLYSIVFSGTMEGISERRGRRSTTDPPYREF